MNDIKKRVFKVVSEVLGINESDISMDLYVGGIAEWDSIRQLIIISSIEEEFNISFSEDDLFELTSVGNIINKVESLLSIYHGYSNIAR